MPSHGGKTTRRQRYIWLRAKMFSRWRKYEWSQYTYFTDLWTHEHFRIGRKWEPKKSVMIVQRLKSGKTYRALQGIGPGSYPYDLYEVDEDVPPHLKIRCPSLHCIYHDLGYNARYPWIWYHVRRATGWVKRPRDKFNTAFNLRVKGSNWFFFRNGCYADDDFLGRHPTFDDILNGAPFPGTLWPEPSGYQYP